MVEPDGFGLDSETGDLYVTDIFGNSIWRISPGGSAQLWTSVATNPCWFSRTAVTLYEIRRLATRSASRESLF
jgi:sugar lactone lactonase YvrE